MKRVCSGCLVLVLALAGCTSSAAVRRPSAPTPTSSSAPDRANTMFCTALKVFSPKLGYLSGPWANLHGGGLILQGVGGGVETGPRYEGELRRAAKLYAAAGDAKAATAIDGLADHFGAMVASARAILHTGTGPNLSENFNKDRRALASAGLALVEYERSHRSDLPKC